ncbi:SPOSA6832_04861 [Sporobolomyces salmonicolor]|uniref:SPOSA6832_04861-mRNA-1:cds n=1 Tax=Sporidiobolus salmonicolor TaxID=5005 RepID=A0A0D6ET22_SPOSA|nr:SPOSA6832_04861 [Sporobolomyces salmonicolor]
MAFPETVPRSPAAVALHVVSFLSLTWSFRQLFKPSPMHDFMASQYGGHWQFLTILSLAAAWLTFAFALLKDAFPSVTLFARLKTTLAIVAVPVEGFVGVLYWSMQLYDPSLLTPPNPLFVLPFHLDISIHGLPAVLLWADFLAFSPPFPKEANPASIAVTATMSYVAWMEFVASRNGTFPYPFLNELTKAQRSIFYLFQIPVVIVLYRGANGLHHLVRGYDKGKEAKTVREAERKAAEKIEAAKEE